MDIRDLSSHHDHPCDDFLDYVIFLTRDLLIPNDFYLSILIIHGLVLGILTRVGNLTNYDLTKAISILAVSILN